MEHDTFIRTYDNAFTKEFCDELIEIFENNVEHQYPGHVGSGVNKKVKDTNDMHSFESPALEPYNRKIFEILNKHLHEYHSAFKIDNVNIFPSNIKDTGYQIQKYDVNKGKYIWHTDGYTNKKDGSRVLTFLFYLNDVEEGGETMILDYKIKPETGKLLLFPPFWNYIHTGTIPKSSCKYILTGWLYVK
tara:strand:- start:593 stop:1159 length:567 start_codon:yes stop_codon:yes gene_type:complete